jgi:hypothetical protein
VCGTETSLIGNWAWMMGVILTTFYIVLLVSRILRTESRRWKKYRNCCFFDPLSYILNGKTASQWFVYGTLYTIAIVGLGYKFILKYLNKYQLVRTLSMFFQLGFAFLIPEILEKLNRKAYFAKDLKNMWPLNYFFNEWHLKNMFEGEF